MTTKTTGIMHSTRSTPSVSAIWQRIDRIYCISLAERNDRQASARAQFARVGLDEKVEFHFARRHPVDCEQGIFESHITCLNNGLRAGARHILVFEDDVVFSAIDPARLSAGIDFFMHQAHGAILFLGCLVGKSRPTQAPDVRRVDYRCLSHAYLVDAELARQIAAMPWQGIAYDGVLRRCTRRHYALYPSIAYQSNSPTDNTRHRVLDGVRRLFGGLRIIQLANEHYHRYPILFIAAHALVIGAVALWIAIR